MNELTTIDKKKSKKILGYVVVIALAAAVIVGQHIYWNRQLTKAEEKEETSSSVVVQDDGTITVNSQTLMSAMKGTDKLIAYEYYYTDAGTYEKGKKLFKTNIDIPFATDRAIFTYGGSLGVGIHADQIEIATDDVKKTIQVTVPPLEILTDTPDYDAFQYYDVKNSVFTSSNLKDFSAFQKELSEKQKKKLKKNKEFWEKAKESTELRIEHMLNKVANLDGYQITFVWKSGNK